MHQNSMNRDRCQHFSLLATALLSLGGSLAVAEPGWAQAFMRTNQPTFFDMGQQRLESEIRTLEQGAPSPVLTVESGIQQWQPITSRAGGFSIWAPLGILADETKTIELDGQSLEFEILSSRVSQGKFVVAFADAPQIQPTTLFPALQAIIVQQTDFKVVMSQAIQLDGAPGQELVLQDDDELLALRMYLGNGRVYLVGVLQAAGSDIASGTQAFLESFRFANP
jgi:hypothetical protein